MNFIAHVDEPHPGRPVVFWCDGGPGDALTHAAEHYEVAPDCVGVLPLAQAETYKAWANTVEQAHYECGDCGVLTDGQQIVCFQCGWQVLS